LLGDIADQLALLIDILLSQIAPTSLHSSG